MRDAARTKNYGVLEAGVGADGVGAEPGAALVSVLEFSDEGEVVVVDAEAGAAFVSFLLDMSGVVAGAGAVLVEALVSAGAGGGVAVLVAVVVSLEDISPPPRLHPVKTNGRARMEVTAIRREGIGDSFIGVCWVEVLLVTSPLC